MTAPIEHGTYAGYQAERKTPGLTPCNACKDAQALYVRQWRRRREVIEPLSNLLARRPELTDLPGAGVRFVAAVAESA